MTADLFPDASGAVFSPCRLYRYRLWRVWAPSQPKIAFLMLNPSTADNNANDPTVERCCRRARMLGFGGIEVANLFAFRATDPREMRKAGDPIGPENDKHILSACGYSDMVICAWGNIGSYRKRADEVVALLNNNNIVLNCLGVTKAGEPQHPLYIGYSVAPTPLQRRKSILGE